MACTIIKVHQLAKQYLLPKIQAAHSAHGNWLISHFTCRFQQHWLHEAHVSGTLYTQPQLPSTPAYLLQPSTLAHFLG